MFNVYFTEAALISGPIGTGSYPAGRRQACHWYAMNTMARELSNNEGVCLRYV